MLGFTFSSFGDGRRFSISKSKQRIEDRPDRYHLFEQYKARVCIYRPMNRTTLDALFRGLFFFGFSAESASRASIQTWYSVFHCNRVQRHFRRFMQIGKVSSSADKRKMYSLVASRVPRFCMSHAALPHELQRPCSLLPRIRPRYREQLRLACVLEGQLTQLIGTVDWEAMGTAFVGRANVLFKLRPPKESKITREGNRC